MNMLRWSATLTSKNWWGYGRHCVLEQPFFGEKMPTPIPRAACARAPLATTSITLLRPGILHSHHFKGTAWGMPQHTTVTHPRSLRTHASTCPGSIVMSSITTPLGSVTDQDRAYVRQAIDLAARALGQTHPNPAVGCVIVKDGEVC